MMVKRKILEHLSVSQGQDVSGSLLLIGVVRSVERIGDLCKNILELSYLYKRALESGPYAYRLIKAEQKINDMFSLTVQAFDEGDKEAANKVISTHLDEIAPELNKMMGD
ncbi:MAG: hypothetical protein U9O94_06855, partial [Nanoarchaeota archaeon]|nr:hypothetical protein [Nanoarchaeota archaeon]